MMVTNEYIEKFIKANKNAVDKFNLAVKETGIHNTMLNMYFEYVNGIYELPEGFVANNAILSSIEDEMYISYSFISPIDKKVKCSSMVIMNYNESLTQEELENKLLANYREQLTMRLFNKRNELKITLEETKYEINNIEKDMKKLQEMKLLNNEKIVKRDVKVE